MAPKIRFRFRGETTLPRQNNRSLVVLLVLLVLLASAVAAARGTQLVNPGRRLPPTDCGTDGDDGDGQGSRFWAVRHSPLGEAPFAFWRAAGEEIFGPKCRFP